MPSPALYRTASLRSRRRRRGLGFSLIELLVVVAIAAILLGIGVPNFSRLVVNNRLDTTTNDFMSALQYARSEATRLRTAVGLQTNAAAGSGDFSAGWQMFVDSDATGTLSAGDQVLRVGPATDAPLTIRGVRPAFGTAIVFNASGGLASGAGFIVVCYGPSLTDGGDPRARAIAVNGSGRVRRGLDSNNDAIPEHDAGAVTTCAP
jgi:type IV fimbrial biogenesis protein FimT